MGACQPSTDDPHDAVHDLHVALVEVALVDVDLAEDHLRVGKGLVLVDERDAREPS